MCLLKIHRCSINARHKLIQFKITHRLHYSKLKVNKMYPNVSALCNKCKNQVGTLTHQLWTCPSLHSFWSSIFDFYSKAFKRLCEPCPLVAILGSAGDSTQYSNNTKSVQQSLCLGAILAKRLILRHWKSDNVPSIEMWMRELSETLCMEKVRYSMGACIKIPEGLERG